jgi:hypothetical protein
LDQDTSWCILSNSWSDIGTKCRPRIVWVPLVPVLKWGGMRGGGWYHNSVKTSIFKILLTLSFPRTKTITFALSAPFWLIFWVVPCCLFAKMWDGLGHYQDWDKGTI